MFSEKRFKAQMVLAGLNQEEVAKALGIHPVTLYRKIRNNGDFSRDEISKLVDILKIDNPQDIFLRRNLRERKEECMNYSSLLAALSRILSARYGTTIEVRLKVCQT